MKLSIRTMLHEYATSLTRTWAHDRSNTVGASEIGQCLRRTWFAKNDAPPDPNHRERYGAMLRGTLIEEHYWVPGLRAALPDDVQLLMAGDAQRTLVDGYLSATPDGLLVGDNINDSLEHLGISDAGDSIAVECKSIDPRVDIQNEKPAHSFQTQCQIGLIRHATAYRPNYALISYTDASFLDDVREFAVRFDPTIYEVAKHRARQVMTTDKPLDMPPEGKFAGGGECKYCPWKSHCAAVTVAGLPPVLDVQLSDNAMTELRIVRDLERALTTRAEEVAMELGHARQSIKDILREHGVRRAKGDDWSVSWSVAKGRETIDTKAAEAAGVDLLPFKKIGDPSDRLVVK